MSTVVLSLFGDEIIPEQINAVGKSKAARKPKAAKNEEIHPEVKEDEKTPPVQASAVMPEAATPANDVISELKTAESYFVTDTVQEVKQEENVPKIATASDANLMQDISAASIIAPDGRPDTIAPSDIIPVGSERVTTSVETVPDLIEIPGSPEDSLPTVEILPATIDVVPHVAEVAAEIGKTVRKPVAKRAKSPVKKTAVKKEVVKKEKPEGHSILEGWTPDKQYYSIGEVAGLFYVATSHIRFWTNEFALKVRTTRKGDRLYSPEQINELRTIYHLVKEKGYTIAGAKARLKEAKKTPVHTLDLKQSLLQLRNKLVDIKNQL